MYIRCRLDDILQVYITARYGEETCNPDKINRTEWDYSQVNKTQFDGAQGPGVKASVVEFLVLLGINAGALIFGYVSYRWKAHQLTKVKNLVGDDEKTVAENENQVDYQLVGWRLQVEKKSDFDLHLAEFRDEEEKAVVWDDKTSSLIGSRASGQQIEDVTLDKVLFTEDDVNTQRKNYFRTKDKQSFPLKRIRVRDFDIRTEGGHRLSGKLKAIVESRHPTGTVEKARQTCKYSIHQCTCCELRCCNKGSAASCRRLDAAQEGPEGSTCAVKCCGKERRCKRICRPPGFAPYKMSIQLRRLRGALYGHESSSSEEEESDDEESATQTNSPNRRSLLKRGRSRAKSMGHGLTAMKDKAENSMVGQGVKKTGRVLKKTAMKGLEVMPDTAVAAAAGLASHTAELAKKGLVAVPLLPFNDEKKIDLPSYMQLLRLLVQTPDLTSLDIQGCDYPLEYFLQDDILEAIPLGRRGKHMTDLEEITIDFTSSIADAKSYVTIRRFSNAKLVVQRIREAALKDEKVLDLKKKKPPDEETDAADAQGSKKRCCWRSKSFVDANEAHHADKDRAKHDTADTVELYPDHLYLLMGYLKKLGRFDSDEANVKQPTLARSTSGTMKQEVQTKKRSRSTPDDSFTWAPKLETLDLSDNTHLIAESHSYQSIEALKRIENKQRAAHKLKFERVQRMQQKNEAEKGNSLQTALQLTVENTMVKEQNDAKLLRAESQAADTMSIWLRVCEGLRENTNICRVRLSNIGMGPAAMELLVHQLLHSKQYPGFGQSLKELDVSRNPLGRVGKATLAESFRMADGLRSLDVLTVSLGRNTDKIHKLSCTVLACKDLHDADIGADGIMGGANDVYVIVSVKDHNDKRTSVIKEGGISPSWDEQQTRHFHWGLDHLTTMNIWVMDQDVLKDDLLGETTIQMTEREGEEWGAPGGKEEWFKLTKNGKNAGEVKLALRWEQSKYVPQALNRTNNSLDLSDRSLTSEDTAFLGGWLHHCRATIEEILINGNPDFVGESSMEGGTAAGEEMLMRVHHFEQFCTALEETTISSLRFSEIGMGPEAAKKLLQLLSTSYGAKLKELDLTSNALGKNGKQTVCKVIAKAQNLEILLIDLGSGPRNEKKAEMTRPSDSTKCQIHFADEHWQLTPDDVEVLAAWVKHCKRSVVSIDLSNNVELANETAIKSLAADNSVVVQRLTHDPWSTFCGALTQTKVLTTLKLRGVGAGVNCAYVLAHAMNAKNGQLGKTLTELDISGNELATDGKDALVGPNGALQGSSIETLCVDFGSGRKTLSKISPALDLSRETSADGDGLVVDDSVTIAGWLTHCSSTVKTLNLSNNPKLIDHHTRSWGQLCETLQGIDITQLRLANVGLGADASAMLAGALQSDGKLRGSLVTLDISRNPMRMGKRSIFAALPGTAITYLVVQIGSDEGFALDATNSDSIKLCETDLQPEDAALLAGWTSHVKDR